MTPTDPAYQGKTGKPSLRELEQQIRRDSREPGIDSTNENDALPTHHMKQNAQKGKCEKSTQKRKQLMRLLKEDKLGARSIDTIKPSDAKEWALRT